MSNSNTLLHRWRKMSISTKFTLASSTLLGLIVLVALTGYIALTAVRRQTEAAIVTSMEIQRLVLEMDIALHNARLSERDFFLRWPLIGFDVAEETYADGNSSRIDELVALGTRLRALFEASDANRPLAVGNVNLNFYLHAADRYATTFDRAVELVGELDAARTGFQTRIATTSARLEESLQQIDDPTLLLAYQEMLSSQKDYLITRQRTAIDEVFAQAATLRGDIAQSPAFTPDQRTEALTHLDDYVAAVREILLLDQEIQRKFNQFDLQVSALEPLSGVLLNLANREVEQARARIARTSALATIFLVVAVVAAVGLAGFIAWVQNKSVTANIVKLTGVAGQLQGGNLKARAEIDTEDELGQLGDTFNTMAAQLDTLIHNLEDKVAERTAELAAANDEITALNEMLKEENLRMGAELEVTKQLQRMLLPTPTELAQVDGLDIAGYMEPADEVGGDYYDVLQHNGQIKIGMGDVTGHGLESGVVMLMTQMGIRTLLTNDETDTTHYLTVLNRTVFNNVQRMQADKSLTLILLDYTPPVNGGPGQVRFSGQHEELIVVRQGGAVELVDTLDLGFPIGLDDDIADFVAERTIQLQPGDGLVLYTDGITEAENDAGEQYELERLCTVVSEHWSKSSAEIKDVVIADVMTHIGEHEVYDDITLLVVKQK